MVIDSKVYSHPKDQSALFVFDLDVFYFVAEKDKIFIYKKKKA